MGLLQRIGDLVAANLNDMVDRCEDPEKMLRQAVRELEVALGQLMDGTARAIAHHKLLVRQLGEERATAGDFHNLAEAAVGRGDDEAARDALMQRTHHVRLAETLARQVASAEAVSERLRHQLTLMRSKTVEARRKLVEVTARNRAAAAQHKLAELLPDRAGANRVWSKFDAVYARVEQSEAEAEALLELLGIAETDVPTDIDVEAELCTLKEAATHVTH